MSAFGSRARQFSGILSPNGVLVVEYRQSGDALDVVEFVAEQPARKDLATASELLARLVESLGGRGGRLALTVSGFGTSHHILTLPPAPPELLRPVVGREMSRFYPDLEDPVIDFVVVGAAESRDGPGQDVLVGAVPRAMVESVQRTLAARGIRLDHVTILPRVLQHIHDSLDTSPDPSVLVLMLQSGPLIGCFFDSDLRLCSEPLPGTFGVPATDVAAVVEHVERGVLFLAQQFPGAGAAAVLVAAPAATYGAVSQAVLEEMDVQPGPLDTGLPANAVAALGAAIDQRSERVLNLLPERLRPEPASQRWARALAAGAALVIAGAALWWSASSMLAARAVDARIGTLQTHLERRVPVLARIQPVLEQRRDHEARLAFLAPAGEREQRVQIILRAVAASTAEGVQLDSLVVTRSRDGWTVGVGGVATGVSSAAAVRAVDVLYRGVPDHVPVDSVLLNRLGAMPADSAGAVAVNFEMSFIVRWEADLGR
ncbi:MAG TPA: hypothetical protein VJ957_12505 [Longimicrobiales bacterium]|nr:hypothetical protein [Longimicrobiales bacterium]